MNKHELANFLLNNKIDAFIVEGSFGDIVVRFDRFELDTSKAVLVLKEKVTSNG